MKKIDIEKSVILSRGSIKGLEKYIGTEGYFTDVLDDTTGYFTDKLDKPFNIVGVLKDILLIKDFPFVSDDSYNYAYFIPKETVVFEEEPKEKKYRPYTDMCGLPFKVGDVITIRTKDSYDIIEALVTEISYKENLISIGSREWCDTQFLLDTFEILINDEWKPLGVEEDEED